MSSPDIKLNLQEKHLVTFCGLRSVACMNNYVQLFIDLLIKT